MSINYKIILKIIIIAISYSLASYGLGQIFDPEVVYTLNKLIANLLMGIIIGIVIMIINQRIKRSSVDLIAKIIKD
ncbi:MAG: hypothetical protein IPM42_07600 [Saprospiraceae bacterium]|nr:hypothetical protein [Saprospiraceae bacterium]